MDDRDAQIFDFHEQLKTSLRRRNSSLSKVARELGVTSAAVSFVGLRKNRSTKIEQALADALETTPEELFPDLYPKGENQ